MSINRADQQDIIQRAIRGDRQAASTLYEKYVDRIYRYIAYRVNDPQDAEDLTAEVFVKMMEGLATYEERGAPFEAWLYSIAQARIIDMRRRNTRRPQTELSDMLESDVPHPEQDLVKQEEVDNLRECLQQLTPEEQKILLLRFVERKSHKEVATIVGKSMIAVKSAQHRALTKLAALLGEEKTRHYLRGNHD